MIESIENELECRTWETTLGGCISHMRALSTLRGLVLSWTFVAVFFSKSTAGLEMKDLMAFGAGPLVVKPHLTVAEQYNDNLFYQSGGVPIDDFITMVTPGLQVQIGRPGTKFDLGVGYSYTHAFYTQNPYIDDTYEHRASVMGKMGGERLQFILPASVSYANTIYGGYESFQFGGLVLLARAPAVERVNYNVNPSLTYGLSEKTSLRGNFGFNGIEFQQPGRFYDVNTWRAALGASYRIRPKIGVVTDVFYGQSAATPNRPIFGVKPHKPPHLETVGGMIGAQGEITPNLTGTIKVGYQQNYYGDDEFGDPVYEGDLAWKISEKSRLELSYRRSSSASAQAAAAYTSDSVGLQFQQSIGTVKPWLLSLGTTYSHNTYEGTGLGKDRDADYFSATFSLFYQFKLWMRTGLSYQYTKTFSGSQSFVDYEVNQVTLSVSIGY